MEETCKACGGDGFVIDSGTEDTSRCTHCGGLGSVERNDVEP